MKGRLIINKELQYKFKSVSRLPIMKTKITREGIEIQSTENNIHRMYSLFIDKSVFESFDINHDTKITFHIEEYTNSFLNFILNTSSNILFDFKKNRDKDYIDIKLTDLETNIAISYVFEIDTIKFLDLADKPIATNCSISASFFSGIIKKMSQIEESHVIIENSPKMLSFLTLSRITNDYETISKIKYGVFAPNIINWNVPTNQNHRVCIKMKYLNDIAKLLSSHTFIKIDIGNDMPLRIRESFGKNSYLIYVIAPYIVTQDI